MGMSWWGSSAKGISLRFGGLGQRVLAQTHPWGAGQSGEHIATLQPQPASPCDTSAGCVQNGIPFGGEVRCPSRYSPGIPPAEQTGLSTVSLPWLLYLWGTRIFLAVGTLWLGLGSSYPGEWLNASEKGTGRSWSTLPMAASCSPPLGYHPVPTKGVTMYPITISLRGWCLTGDVHVAGDAETGGQAPGEEACGDAASGWTIPVECCSSGTMPPKEWLPLATTAHRPRVAGLSPVPAPGRGLQQCQGAGKALVPALVVAQHLGRPRHIALAAHRARIVTRLAAPAGTPTSGHGACPGPAPGLRERESSWSGENAFLLLLAPGEKGSFFIQGFADRAFQLPLEQRLLCHRVGDKGRPKKKKKSKSRLEGWALQQ